MIQLGDKGVPEPCCEWNYQDDLCGQNNSDTKSSKNFNVGTQSGYATHHFRPSDV